MIRCIGLLLAVRHTRRSQMKERHAFNLLHNAQTPLTRFVVDLLYNKSESTTNPQQIEAMEFGFNLLWTCCSVAANQRADVDDVLKLRIT